MNKFILVIIINIISLQVFSGSLIRVEFKLKGFTKNEFIVSKNKKKYTIPMEKFAKIYIDFKDDFIGKSIYLDVRKKEDFIYLSKVR